MTIYMRHNTAIPLQGHNQGPVKAHNIFQLFVVIFFLFPSTQKSHLQKTPIQLYNKMFFIF